jgi:hypothetical protein
MQQGAVRARHDAGCDPLDTRVTDLEANMRIVHGRLDVVESELEHVKSATLVLHSAMDTARVDIEKLRAIVRSDPWYMLRIIAALYVLYYALSWLAWLFEDYEYSRTSLPRNSHADVPP